MKDPIFIFDSEEKWFPVGVEESLSGVGWFWGRARPDRRGADGWWKDDKTSNRLDFPPDMEPPNIPPVIYKRRVEGYPLDFDQYWMWYPYNPGPRVFRGVGRHEGDWEFVQIGHRERADIVVTCSQHHEGGKREFWACQKDKDGRPLIYVALGSHANFFTPGVHAGGQDSCDGKGKKLSIYEVRKLDKQPWKEWPGRWGNSTGAGSSPQSPGCQILRWKQPHLFHSNAKSQ